METEMPEVTSLESFNGLARRRGWKVRGDGIGRFYLPETGDLNAIWRANAGPRVPFRGTMTARLLKRYLKILVLHERITEADGGHSYRARLMGEEMADLIGHGNGKLYSDFVAAPLVPVWHAMSDAVLAHGGPVRFLLCEEQANSRVGEAFAAPLLTDDGRMDLILSAVRFVPIWTWETVLAHWEEDLAAVA